MPEDTSKRNRVVRTKDAAVALAGYRLDSDGTQLFEFMVDAQSNEVTIKHTSHARYGKDFVEADEDTKPLRDHTNELIDQQVEAGVALPGVTPGHTVFNPGHVVNEPPEEWEKLKFATKAEWKAWVKAGKPAR